MTPAEARSVQQQVRDALWYLRRPGQAPEDEARAIAILEAVAGESGLVGRIEEARVPGAAGLAARLRPVRGSSFAVAPGHEPGGGAPGERGWNVRCAKALARLLVASGARVYYYEHREKEYARRQAEFAAAVEREVPGCLAVVELHYDDVPDAPAAAGHCFQYRGSRELAECMRDAWQARFPNSRPRHDNGILRNLTGNGSGFLRMAPGWACLTEPYFRSNPAEWAFYKDRAEEVAEVYALGLAGFAKFKNKK